MRNPALEPPQDDSPLSRMMREQGSRPVWTAMKCCGEYPLVLGEIEGTEGYLCPVCHTIYGDDRKRRGPAFR